MKPSVPAKTGSARVRHRCVVHPHVVRASVEHAIALGPARALTGPVARGDAATVAAHLAAIPDEERRAYRAMADAARVLAARDDPELVELLTVGDDG